MRRFVVVLKSMISAADKDLTTSAAELSSLLLCAQITRDPTKISELKGSASQVKDWNDTIKKADRHGLVPLLYSNLFAHCPEAIAKTELQDRFKANAVSNLMRTQELLQVLAFFEEAGIRAIPYKGPVLAASVYKNLALREFCDLDILVDVQDVTHAIELLVSNGYECATALHAKQLSAYLRSGCELCFSSNGVALELHWQVAPTMFSLPFTFADLWSRRQMLSLGESEVPVLSAEDTLLVLCVHAAKHSWNSLCWLVDIAEVLRSPPPLNGQVTIERARAIGAERILRLGILLAHELFSAPIPETIKQSLHQSGSVGQLSAYAMQKLRSPDAGTDFSISDHLFFIRSRERWSDKVTYVFRAIFTPDLVDWQSAKLPAWWSPLYRLVRLSRLLKKFVSIATPHTKVKPIGTAKTA